MLLRKLYSSSDKLLKKVIDIIIFSVIITVIEIYGKLVAGYWKVRKQEGGWLKSPKFLKKCIW